MLWRRGVSYVSVMSLFKLSLSCHPSCTCLIVTHREACIGYFYARGGLFMEVFIWKYLEVCWLIGAVSCGRIHSYLKETAGPD